MTHLNPRSGQNIARIALVTGGGSVKPEFVYSHHWGVNDLVMWDNRCAMHLAPADYARDEIRQMYRTTLAGEPHGRLLE